ncbi:MAG: transglutaminase domain-containing protein [Clostridiales bacterium]|nr:transglutaminase domain-containing protein [Clostridiales bacterium]
MKKKEIVLVSSLFLSVVLVGIGVGYHINYSKALIKPEVIIETGSEVVIDDFLEGSISGVQFYTDVSLINTSVPGSYLLYISYEELGAEFHQDVVLNVVDTTAPEGEAVPQTVYTGCLPQPEEVVTNVEDLAQVQIAYKTVPDVSHSGEYVFQVSLTDESGNEKIIDVPFTVIDDHLAPLIYGAHDIEVFIGRTSTFLNEVYVTDDYDPSPEFIVDLSHVDLTAPGTYPLTYIAIDENGNKSSVTVNITMRDEPERYYEPEALYDLCRQLNELYGIYTEDMTDVQKAFRIFNWSHQHIIYMNDSDRTDWTCAAYDGLTTLRGDCYTYYAVNRAFLDMEGIPNMLVSRYPVTWSAHYWNLVYLEGEWYHCDSLAFSAPDGYYFMCAVEDMNPYDHRYDESLYGPEINIAQSPVGQYVHYDTLEVDEF